MAVYHVSRLVVFEVKTDNIEDDGGLFERDADGNVDPIGVLDEFGPTYDCVRPVRYIGYEGDTVVEEVSNRG